MMDFNEDLLQYFIIFLIKFSGSGVESENIPNRELADKFHNPIIREYGKRKVFSSFRDNIQGTDLADIQLICKYDKGFCFYYVLLIFIVNMYGLLF